MSKKLLINATHPEETRIAVVNGEVLEEFDSETTRKRPIKGNIYLAKVSRIEPSLQAAFVDYGGLRHGFLPFGEIHPDYYRIPVSERHQEIVTKAEPLEGEESSEKTEEIPDKTEEPIFKEKKIIYRYKIQEVIKKNQILLVQVGKEERGNKGAALTTYLSLSGRYCVLMPNAGLRTGGVSRKIIDGEDRKRLREIVKSLDVPESMSLIIRTAGKDHNKREIKRDYDYLTKFWEDIRRDTLQSMAPSLIYEEGNLIKKAIRDIYTGELEQILVEGEEAYQKAKAFMKDLMPSHAKKIRLYKNQENPLFHSYHIEDQIKAVMEPIVQLPSGGYLVINTTEALVAIDVNSGKSNKERSIQSTALKTNLEGAQEIARQMRLRDLSGLVVIDFIDMHDPSDIYKVEKCLRDAIKDDRARIQLGKISQFGLLELSRQRLRPSVLETHTTTCQNCHGTGTVLSIESSSLQILRSIELKAINETPEEMIVKVSDGVDLYLLNQKRAHIAEIEEKYNLYINILRDKSITGGKHVIELIGQKKKKEEKPHQILTQGRDNKASSSPQSDNEKKANREVLKKSEVISKQNEPISDDHKKTPEKIINNRKEPSHHNHTTPEKEIYPSKNHKGSLESEIRRESETSEPQKPTKPQEKTQSFNPRNRYFLRSGRRRPAKKQTEEPISEAPKNDGLKQKEPEKEHPVVEKSSTSKKPTASKKSWLRRLLE